MTKDLKILEDAISDVGLWTWWESEDADYIQIEFAGVQLWNAPTAEHRPPSGKIALRFDGVKYASFLTFEEDVPSDWPRLLHEDEIDSIHIHDEQFSLSDPQIIRGLLTQSIKEERLSTSFATSLDWDEATVKIGFRAGPVGLVVAAEEMNLLSFQGPILLREIEEKNQKWWDYWKEYWRLKDMKKPLPEDYACEVTIPAG